MMTLFTLAVVSSQADQQRNREQRKRGGYDERQPDKLNR
jgi:hypothetical protein